MALEAVTGKSIIDVGICIRPNCTQQRTTTYHCSHHSIQYLPEIEAIPVVGHYSTVHNLLRIEYGTNLWCYHCGLESKDWAYTHLDPYEIYTKKERFLYSIWPKYYIPLCRQCHIAMDRWHKRMFNKIHSTAIVLEYYSLGAVQAATGFPVKLVSEVDAQLARSMESPVDLVPTS